MRQELPSRCLLAASVLAAASLASAQTPNPDNGAGLKLEQDPPATLNHFGLSYRLGFNISARFKNLGGYPGPNRRGTTPSGDPWNYDNGYNLNDAPGTPPGMTWYWGYVNPSQVPGDGFLYLSKSSSAPDLVSDSKSDDPQHGFEFTYNRELGKIGRAHWGLEGAFNFMNVSIQNNQGLFGTVTTETNAFSTMGQAIPQAPYFQPNAPGGIVIADTPSATNLIVSTGAAMVTGQRKIDADIYGFRLGPYVEVPLFKKLSLSLSGGLALAAVNSRFTFNETVTIPGFNPINSSGSGSDTGFLVGGYASGNLSYAFTSSWSAFAGVQYQHLGRFHQEVSGKQAELDLGKSLFVNIGVGFSF